MDKNIDNKQLQNKRKPALDALYKKAVGYNVEESVEEYVKATDDELLTLSKKKITTKHVPPDITALKLLLEMQGESDLCKLTDIQLQEEKQRLLQLLQDLQKDGK